MYKVECPKCGGKGNIKMYSGIMGGVCFSCGGRGYKEYKNKPVEKKNFAIKVLRFEDNKVISVFNKTGKDAAEALEKARKTMKPDNKTYDWRTLEAIEE